MSERARDYVKGTILTLVLSGLGYILSGPIVGVICLVFASFLSLILWTPVGPWLGLGKQRAPTPPSTATLREKCFELGEHIRHFGAERRKSRPSSQVQTLEYDQATQECYEVEFAAPIRELTAHLRLAMAIAADEANELNQTPKDPEALIARANRLRAIGRSLG